MDTVDGIATDDVGIASIMLNRTNLEFISTENLEDAGEYVSQLKWHLDNERRY